MGETKENGLSLEEALERLRELRARHACEVELAEGRRVKSIHPSESGKSKQDYATIGEINSFIAKHGLVLDEETSSDGKKKYRRREELPDPSQPADAEVNRPTEQFKIRVRRDLKAELARAAKEQGVSQQDWVIEAILAKLHPEK